MTTKRENATNSDQTTSYFETPFFRDLFKFLWPLSLGFIIGISILILTITNSWIKIIFFIGEQDFVLMTVISVIIGAVAGFYKGIKK